MIAPGSARESAAASPTERTQSIQRAVRDFEAQLLGILVNGMRKAFLEDDQGTESMYMDLAASSLADALAAGRNGHGIGLTAGMAEHLQALDRATAGGQDPIARLTAAARAAAAQGHALAATTAPHLSSMTAGNSTGLDMPALATPQAAGPPPAINSSFGARRDPFTGKTAYHRGIDLRAPLGEPVRTAAAGVVVRAEQSPGFGRHVVVRHPGGVESVYAHLESIDVAPGQEIPRGARIGAVGMTGRATAPHLHFEVRAEGQAVDPQQFVAGRHGWRWPVGSAAGGADHVHDHGADHVDR